MKKSRITNIVIALLLAFSFILPLGYQLPALAKAASKNLLTNADFESGTTGWKAVGGCKIAAQTSVVKSGKKALKVSGRDKASDAVRQDITSVLKKNGEGTYTLSLYSRLAKGSDTVKAEIEIETSTETKTYLIKGTVPSNKWTQLKGNVKIAYTGNIKKAYLHIYTNKSTSDLLVDKTSLTLKEAPVVNTPKGNGELLKNGNLSSDLDYWYGFGATIELTDDGIKTTERKDFYFSPAQNVTETLKANGKGLYNIKTKVKLEKGTDAVKVNVRVKDSTGMTEYYSFIVDEVGTDWTECNGAIALNWNGTLTDALFYIETMKTLNNFYIKDCSVKLSN